MRALSFMKKVWRKKNHFATVSEQCLKYSKQKFFWFIGIKGKNSSLLIWFSSIDIDPTQWSLTPDPRLAKSHEF